MTVESQVVSVEVSVAGLLHVAEKGSVEGVVIAGS